MDRGKVVTDWLLAIQDTIYTLQMWSESLENWQVRGFTEPDDFADACQQLKEAGLWAWASEAGGHGIKSLAVALEISEAEEFSSMYK
jgi:hypothetical protein